MGRDILASFFDRMSIAPNLYANSMGTYSWTYAVFPIEVTHGASLMANSFAGCRTRLWSGRGMLPFSTLRTMSGASSSSSINERVTLNSAGDKGVPCLSSLSL